MKGGPVARASARPGGATPGLHIAAEHPTHAHHLGAAPGAQDRRAEGGNRHAADQRHGARVDVQHHPRAGGRPRRHRSVRGHRRPGARGAESGGTARRLRRAGPRERRADPPEHRHAALPGPHHGPPRRRLPMGPDLRAGPRRTVGRLPGPALSRVRDPRQTTEPGAGGPCREIAGGLGGRAGVGADARRPGSSPTSRRGTSGVTAGRRSRSG